MTTVLERIKNKNNVNRGNKIDFEYAEKRYGLRNNPKGEILKSKRRIGIEFECTTKNLNVQGKLSDEEVTINGEKHKTLVPYSFGGDDFGYSNRSIEIVTPPIRLKNGELDVKYFCENVGKYARLTGWEGTHVHVEAIDVKKDKQKSVNLIRFMAMFETVIYNCLTRTRKRSDWCKTIKKNWLSSRFGGTEDSFYEDLFDVSKSNDDFIRTFISGRTESGFAYNTGGQMDRKSVQEMGHGSPTIEIRYHYATLNADEILRWASLFQFLFDNVDKLTYNLSLSMLLYTKNPVKMLNFVSEELKMPEDIKNYILEKIKKNSSILNRIKWGIN